MATATLTVSSVLAATGWTGATVANLSASDDTRATGGTAGELIRGEFSNAPGDFSTMSQIQIAVEARVVGTVSRDKTLRIELLDSADNVLETTDNPNVLTSTDANYFSAPWSRTDSKSVVDGYRFRVTVLEGGGMGDSATVEIDYISATLTYTPTETRTGSGSPSFPVFEASGAGSLKVTGEAAATFPTFFTNSAGSIIDVSGSGAGTFPAFQASGSGTKDYAFIRFLESRVNTSAGNFTLSSVNLGPARSDRYIIVGVAGKSSFTPGNVTSMTINGVTASLIAITPSSSYLNGMEIWGALVTSGTSGDIVINTSLNSSVGVGVWSLQNKMPETAPFYFDAVASNTGSGTIDVPEGGGVLGFAQSTDSGTNTFTNLTEDYDELVESDAWHHGGHDNYEAAQSSLSISYSDTNNDVFIAMSFQPKLFGDGGALFPSFTTSGSGTVTSSGVTHTGTGAASFPMLTTSASGEVVKTGTGAVTFPSFEASGAGTVFTTHTGTGAVTFPVFTATGTGDIVKTGTGTATFPTFEASGAGNILTTHTGSGAATFAVFEASGSGRIAYIGTGDATFPAFETSGTGDAFQAINGTAAVTFGTFSASGAGTIVKTGTAAVTFPSFTASGDGVIARIGTGAATFAAFEASGAGQRGVTGTVSATFATFEAGGSGDVFAGIGGSGAAVFPVFTADASGVVVKTGTGTATFPSFTASGDGVRVSKGNGNAVFPSFTTNGAGGGPGAPIASGGRGKLLSIHRLRF